MYVVTLIHCLPLYMYFNVSAMLANTAENNFLTVLSVLMSHCFECFRMTQNYTFSFRRKKNHGQSSMLGLILQTKISYVISTPVTNGPVPVFIALKWKTVLSFYFHSKYFTCCESEFILKQDSFRYLLGLP